jgi:hypothetical protein
MLNILLLTRLFHIATGISIAVLSSIVTSINNTPCAEATTAVSEKSIGEQQLISELDKSSANLNIYQKADVKGINQTLTQYYRGANELDFKRVGRSWKSYSVAKKASDRELLSEIKAKHIDDISIEVKKIDLLSLSQDNATLEIEEIMRLRKGNRSRELQRLLKFTMVKINSSWKITGIDNVRKPILSGDEM